MNKQYIYILIKENEYIVIQSTSDKEAIKALNKVKKDIEKKSKWHDWKLKF